MEYEKKQRIYKTIMLVILVAVITFIVTTVMLYNKIGGNSGNVKYVMIGKGNVKNELIEYAKSNNVTNVEFLDPVLKDNMDNVLQLLDIGYIGLKKQNLFSEAILMFA